MGIDATRHVYTIHLWPVLRIGQNTGWYDTGFDDVLLVVNIVQEHVQRLHALNGAARKHAPLMRTKQTRNHIKRNQTLFARSLTIYIESNTYTSE